MNQIETTFQALLGRSPLPHEMAVYEDLKSSPRELGLKLMASQEFRKRAMLGEFPAGSTQWVCAEIREGIKLWVDLMDAGVSAGAIADNWEPSETNFILSILKNGSTFLDIGAHIGWFSVLAAHKVGHEGRVYSFEPRPAIFERMRASIEANHFEDRCVMQCAALSDKVGTASIATFSSEFNSGHAFMVTGEVSQGASLITDIPMLVLDNMVWDRRIDLIKIDVEGAEAMVIRGARELIRRDQPIIVSEFFPRWLQTISGISGQEFIASLKEFGYRIFELTHSGIGKEIHSLGKTRSFESEYFTNIVAITDQHIDQYLLRPLDGRVEAYEIALTEMQTNLAAEKARNAKQAEMLRQSEAKLVDEREKAHESALTEMLHQNEEKLVALQAAHVLEKESHAQQVVALLRNETKILKMQNETNSRLEGATLQNNNLIAQISILEEQVAFLTAQRTLLQASNVWRGFLVIIRIARRIPAPIRKYFVRALKLGWWTTTGQLSQRWKVWRQIRQYRDNTVAISDSVIPFQGEKKNRDAVIWDDRRGPVVLIVDSRLPEPDRDSGSLDAVNLVRDLVSMGLEVIYAAVGDRIQDQCYRDGLIALGARPLPQIGASYVQKYIEDNRDLFTLVVLTRVSGGGAFFELVRYNCPDAKIIFNTVDLHFLREQRMARMNGDMDMIERANQTRDREEWLVGHADLTIVVSETEREILTTAVPRAPVLHLPLARDIISPTAFFSKRNGIGFVGGFAHQPNLDAVLWFIAEIWPLVRLRYPELIFFIAGSNFPEEMVKHEDGVIYVGHVEDLHAWFETLILSVAPLRVGAGAKGKVASSLANGLPCVVSTVAAEGMKLTDGENVLIADTPEAFADKIIALISDEALWKKISSNGLRFAMHEFSHQRNLHDLHEALIKIGVPVPCSSELRNGSLQGN